MTLKRPSTFSKSYHDTFNSVNERVVEDISLEFFYKPHTITLLAVSIAAVVYSSFIRDERDVEANIRAGVCCVIFFFMIVSVLAFPNGPFTRPHPAVWRIVFGFSVLYLMLLVFCLFQNYKTVKQIIYWFDPELEHFHIDMDREYGVNCSVITFDNIWNHMDVFALAHFLGWAFKAILVRHLGILWAVSVMWEFTEIAFAHLLPNFVECWWDALILDVLLCNGLGIWVGLRFCKILEMREYKWVSIRDIHSTTGKLKRAVLQFTPSDWMQVRWLDPSTTYMRFFAICQLVIFWQVCELNTFFLKHIFEMPPSHPLVYLRLLLVGIVVAPSIRQYYMYVTDPSCKRVGTQCWVYGAIMATEALLCIKNGKELFGQTQATNICIWLLLIFLLSCLCVYGCVVWHKYFQVYYIALQLMPDCVDMVERMLRIYQQTKELADLMIRTNEELHKVFTQMKLLQNEVSNNSFGFEFVDVVLFDYKTKISNLIQQLQLINEVLQLLQKEVLPQAIGHCNTIIAEIEGFQNKRKQLLNDFSLLQLNN